MVDPLGLYAALGICVEYGNVSDSGGGNLSAHVYLTCIDEGGGSSGGPGGSSTGGQHGGGGGKGALGHLAMAAAVSSSVTCQQKAQNIQSIRNEILNRFQAYDLNLLPLPLTGKMSRAGHLQKIGDKQRQLQTALNDYRTSGCGGSSGNDGLPSDANQVAFAPLPALSPSRPTASQLLEAGAIIAGVLAREAPAFEFAF